MCQQIFPPRSLDGRLESQDQDLLPTHLQCQLICGERLSETHLCIPKEMRNETSVRRVCIEPLEEVGSLLYGSLLFRSHPEIIDSFGHHFLTFNDRCNCSLNGLEVASEPFSFRVMNSVSS